MKIVNNSYLRFDGQVAIITGAARGLGREYALLLASRGATIIVNDLGGSRDGSGQSNAAEDVVQEIVQSGGIAVSDYNSVEDGNKIVQAAIDRFGRIDILINNAGILRDKSIVKMTEEDWDIVHRIHLRSSFLITKAAWPYFRKQNYGRIVMTASSSGIYGNFGQANYSSAKLGLLSLAKTLAVEGEKYNIKCNTIVPVAASRLTEDLLPDEMAEIFKPIYVAPIVAFLCHQTCPTNGDAFEAAGGFYGKYRWQRSKGKVFNKAYQVTIEDIRNSWEEISDMSEFTSPISMQDHTLMLMEQLKYQESNNRIKTPIKKVSTKAEIKKEFSFNFNANDAILYALAVGVSTDDQYHLKYLYENNEDFSVIPTFGTTISLNALYDSGLLTEVVEKYNLQDNIIQSLHGEQYLKIYEPIPSTGQLFSKPKILDVLDKGSGALIIFEIPTYDQNNTLIFYNQITLFMIGSGNFNGKRSSNDPKVFECIEPPNREPDMIVNQQTTSEQAALFRLCGDKNPLHIDPDFSIIGGFNRPILHGLCVLGFAVRHALRQFYEEDSFFDANQLIDAVKVRFVGAIIPGQTIVTHIWRSSSSSLLSNNNTATTSTVRIHFECYVKETGQKIISSAFVDLKPYASPREITVAASSSKLNNRNFTRPYEKQTKMTNLVPEFTSELKKNDAFIPENSEECKIDKIFGESLTKKICKHPEIVQMIQTIYQFNISKNGTLKSIWTLDLKNEPGKIFRGIDQNIKPNCTLIVDDDIITSIFEGKEDALQAFMSGRLKVTGNVLAAQKLQQIWSENALKENSSQDDKINFNKKSTSINEDNTDKELLESIPISGLKCDLIFTIIRNRMHEEPELVRRITAGYQFNITAKGKPAAIWTAENKTNPQGAIYNQPYKNGKPDCLVTVDDDDFVKLMFGKLNPQRAFMLGKLKVKGNIMLLQRLNSIWIELQKSGKAPEIPYLMDLISQTSLIPGYRSEMIIVELIQRLVRLPYLCNEVNNLIGFQILKNNEIGVEYTLDFNKNKETGVFYRGLPDSNRSCVLTMSDEDFVRLTYHRFTLEDGIKMNKIKVKGNLDDLSKISIVFKTPTSRVKL